MTERQGIEIDYCPTCRGVWLDRGELDKLIERSGEYAAPRAPDRDERRDDDRYRDDRSRDDRGYDVRREHDDKDHHHKKSPSKRAKGVLGDNFDF
jgi:Zn-finger nucleic acid-binding protein